MRVIARATTRYWGLVFLFGFFVPIGLIRSLALVSAEQSVPAVPPPTVPPAAPGTPVSAAPATALVPVLRLALPGPVLRILPAPPPINPLTLSRLRQLPLPAVGTALTALPKPPPYVSATLAWSQVFEATVGMALVATADSICAITTDGDEPGRLSAHALSTGVPLWTHAVTGWQQIVAGGSQILGLLGSRIVAMDARTGVERWRLEVGGGPQALATVEEWLIVSGGQEILAVNLDTGAVVWRQPANGLSRQPAVASRTVIVGLAGGTMAAFNVVNGVERWRRPVGADVSAMSAAGGVVYAALSNGSLCAYGATDGTIAWGCQRLRVPATGPPLVDGDVVHIALLDNTLRSFDRRSGVTRQLVDLGQRPAGPPEAADRSVVVPLISGAFARVFPIGPPERLSVAPASTFANLQRAVVADGGRLLISLHIPPGGPLQMTALRLRAQHPQATTARVP